MKSIKFAGLGLGPLVRRLIRVAPVRIWLLVVTVMLNVGTLGASSMYVAGLIDLLNGDRIDARIKGSLVAAFGLLLLSAVFASFIGPQFLPIMRRVILSELEDLLEVQMRKGSQARATGEQQGSSSLIEEVVGFRHRQALGALVDWLRQRSRGLAGIVILGSVAPVLALVCGVAFIFYGQQFTRLLADILESMRSGDSLMRRRADYMRKLVLKPGAAGEWRTLGCLAWLQSLYVVYSETAVGEANDKRENGLNQVALSAVCTFGVVGGTVSFLVVQAWAGNITVGALMLALLGLIYSMDLGPIGDTAVLVRQAAKTEADIGQLWDGQKPRPDARTNIHPQKTETKSTNEGSWLATMEGVRFSYSAQSKFSLRIDEFRVKRGEFVAIVGPNGSGKTTFIDLLTRQLEPDEGHISGSTRQLSVVPQDSVRYPTSLWENVALGDNSVSVLQSLRSAGISQDLVDRESGRVLLEAGAMGSELSGGQWQRVAVARGLGRDSDLFILDEPSAALDIVGEAAVFGALLERRARAAVVVTTHHLANTRFVDRIIVLGEGRIVEQGTHDALMRLSGRYAKMFQAQASGVGVAE